MVKTKLSDLEIRRIAAESLVDVRTIRKFVAGEVVRASCAERIKTAAKSLRIKVAQ